MIVRKNTGIKYVIFHHSGMKATLSGVEINNLYSKEGYFGMPYDMYINFNGTIDLSPRWVLGNDRSQIRLNSSVLGAVSYNNHHISGLDIADYNKNSIHIAVAGNFDITPPSIFQKQVIKKLLATIFSKFDIDKHTHLLYYSDVTNTSSPGYFFYKKPELYSVEAIRRQVFFTDNIDFTVVKGNLLTEEGDSLLTEDGKVLNA